MDSPEQRHLLSDRVKLRGSHLASGFAAAKLTESLTDDLNIATLKTLTAEIIQGFDYDYLRMQFSEEEWIIGDLRELVLILSHVIRIDRALSSQPKECVLNGDGLINKLLAY